MPSFRSDIGPPYGRLWYCAVWHCGCRTRANVNSVVDLAAGTSRAAGAADFPFKFNGTGVHVRGHRCHSDLQDKRWLRKPVPQRGRQGISVSGLPAHCGKGLAITSNLVFSIANATIADVTALNNLGNILSPIYSAVKLASGRWMSMSIRARPDCRAGLPGLIMACGGLTALARRRRKLVV